MITTSTKIHECIQYTQWTVADMVKAIQSRYETLEPRRQYMFIEWLHAHSHRVNTAITVYDGLMAWLEAMGCENLPWEYRLIMDEIDWWSNLDERSLTKIMLADLARNKA